MAAFFCPKANAKRQWTDSFGRVTASGTGGERISFISGITVCDCMRIMWFSWWFDIFMKLQPAVSWWILSHQPWFAEVAMLFEFCPGGHLLNLLDKAEAPARHSKMRQVTGIQKRIPYLESVMSLIQVPKCPLFFFQSETKARFESLGHSWISLFPVPNRED